MRVPNGSFVVFLTWRAKTAETSSGRPMSTYGSWMKGATLPQIGQVLRHRDLATAALYAKVDLAS
jgi:hypothetical protein